MAPSTACSLDAVGPTAPGAPDRRAGLTGHSCVLCGSVRGRRWEEKVAGGGQNETTTAAAAARLQQTVLATAELKYQRDLSKKKKKIKTRNSKMTTNSQLSTTELKKQKQTKQTTRTGTKPQKWRSHGGLSAGRGENEGKGTGNKKHK